VFKLRPEELELFFERDHQKHPDNEGELRECLIILEHVKYYEGLIKSLATDRETGIIGDVKDIKRRKKFFGKNKKSLPSVRTFWQILWDQFDERYIQILLVFATVSLVVSIFTKSENGANSKKWLEAISIYFAVLFAAMVQTFCDWGKEKQFLRLQNEIQNEKVTVLRGQYGTSQTVLSKDLVVGDIVLLNQGDRVPADCILVQEMDMHVDQQSFFPDMMGSENTVKQCSYANVE
jgi:magnesium-transporting ATPase (P-type)